MAREILFFLGVVILCGCHPRPVEDMVLADVAVKAAQKVKADVLAPDVFRQAENYYLRAKKDYTEGYYDSAKKFANDARMMAEQAEYKALVKQSQLKGGMVEPEPQSSGLKPPSDTFTKPAPGGQP